MRRRKPLALFFGGFALLYILLILPWPGWANAYGSWFRMLGRTVYYNSKNGQRELTFERLGEKPHPDYTRIEIVNRALMQSDGSGPVWNYDLDPMAFGWRQTALLIALVVATPIPWRRRAWALLWGLICVQAIIVGFLGFCIWNESANISLATLTPFWQQIADGIQDFVLWQYSAVVPVLVWLLVTFRKEDRLLSVCLSLFGPAKSEARSGAKETGKAEEQAPK